jgi:hypothetical protein
MHTLTRASLASIMLLTMSVASAAPFCVVTGTGKRCFYADEQTCGDVAKSVGGTCVKNDERQRPPPGGAPYCVVSYSGTQCNYQDLKSCETAARAVNGACETR